MLPTLLVPLRAPPHPVPPLTPALLLADDLVPPFELLAVDSDEPDPSGHDGQPGNNNSDDKNTSVRIKAEPSSATNGNSAADLAASCGSLASSGNGTSTDMDDIAPVVVPGLAHLRFLLGAASRHYGADAVAPDAPLVQLVQSAVALAGGPTITPASSDGSGVTQRRVSKWHDRHWKNRDVLYDSLDRVIRDLNRSQVLRVFDMPVTDLEAPNYSRTITNPMSFATMREKLARTEYRNKMQFASDIELIADNCILYNGINSVYGGYADQLRTKARTLLQRIDETIEVAPANADEPIRTKREHSGTPFSTSQSALPLSATSSSSSGVVGSDAHQVQQQQLRCVIKLEGGGNGSVGESTPTPVSASAPIRLHLAPTTHVALGPPRIPFREQPSLKFDPTWPLSIIPLPMPPPPLPPSFTNPPHNRSVTAALASRRSWRALRIHSVALHEARARAEAATAAAAAAALEAGGSSLGGPTAAIPAAPALGIPSNAIVAPPMSIHIPPLGAAVYGEAEPPSPMTEVHANQLMSDGPDVARVELETAHWQLRRALAMVLGASGYDTVAGASIMHVLADVWCDALMKMATAAVLVRNEVRPPLAGSDSNIQIDPATRDTRALQAALAMGGLTPLQVYDHAVLEVVRGSARLLDLERRVEGKRREVELHEATGHASLPDDLDMGLFDDLFSGGAILAGMLGEDIFGLGSAQRIGRKASAISDAHLVDVDDDDGQEAAASLGPALSNTRSTGRRRLHQEDECGEWRVVVWARKPVVAAGEESPAALESSVAPPEPVEPPAPGVVVGDATGSSTAETAAAEVTDADSGGIDLLDDLDLMDVDVPPPLPVPDDTATTVDEVAVVVAAGELAPSLTAVDAITSATSDTAVPTTAAAPTVLDANEPIAPPPPPPPPPVAAPTKAERIPVAVPALSEARATATPRPVIGLLAAWYESHPRFNQLNDGVSFKEDPYDLTGMFPSVIREFKARLNDRQQRALEAVEGKADDLAAKRPPGGGLKRRR